MNVTSATTIVAVCSLLYACSNTPDPAGVPDTLYVAVATCTTKCPWLTVDEPDAASAIFDDPNSARRQIIEYANRFVTAMGKTENTDTQLAFVDEVVNDLWVPGTDAETKLYDGGQTVDLLLHSDPIQ